MSRQNLNAALAPQMGASCRILVLGSMPGTASLRAAEYYAHPRNLFWDCIETAFQIDRKAPYQTRLAALHKVNVGLWDVLATCSREASSDATIRDAQCNDFAQLLQNWPDIKKICLNGRAAADHWRRLIKPSFANASATKALNAVEIISLPSTSPANAAMARAAKIAAWRSALIG